MHDASSTSQCGASSSSIRALASVSSKTVRSVDVRLISCQRNAAASTHNFPQRCLMKQLWGCGITLPEVQSICCLVRHLGLVDDGDDCHVSEPSQRSQKLMYLSFSTPGVHLLLSLFLMSFTAALWSVLLVCFIAASACVYTTLRSGATRAPNNLLTKTS